MYRYSNLKAQCSPQTCATTSHQMFIQPEVVPVYTALNMQKQPDKKTIKKNQWSRDPKQWGPHLWFYLHTAAANYPVNPSQAQKNGMKEWLCSLRWTIPCSNCSNHFGKYIEKHSSELDDVCSSRDKLFSFLHEIHNKVNERKNKPLMTLEKARELYY